MCLQVAKEATAQRLSPLKIKKIYVLAALMVIIYVQTANLVLQPSGDFNSLNLQIDSHISHNRQQQRIVKTEREAGTDARRHELSTTLQDLLTEDYSSVTDVSLLGSPWRTVEAYHFFLLVQKLFYAGHLEESLKTVSK